MIVSLNWLKEYVKLDDNLEIREICEKLTMSGSKVEKYIEYGKKTEKVYTGLVEKVERHPMDNNLKKVTLNLGENNYTAVANIPDIEEGQIVPVALPGAIIIDKEVKACEIKNVESNCMICHIHDLGLNKELYPMVHSSGLIVFPSDVELGRDINDVLGLGDYIIEFEITPNRPDCLSVEGLARELAVTFDLECKDLWQDKEVNFSKVSKMDDISVNLDTENCKKYVLNVAKDVKITSSPFDMQLKLIKSGFSVINNIVDITNFVMLEIGQPLHAFDKKTINGNITVRQAKNGENLITLDGETRDVSVNNMVISDDKNVVAIAGVMGGMSSGIKDTTTEVVFESASFVRGSVRNTSKALTLRTDASSRYEKGLPSKLTEAAMNRVCNLINSLGIGSISLTVIDVDNSEYIPSKLFIDYEKINKIVGIDLSREEIDKILLKLNMPIKYGIVSVPYYREDVNIIEDLAEEVARIYGYDKLPYKLPDTSMTFGYKTDMQKFVDKLKTMSLNKGFSEIYTYTFFSMDTLKKATVTHDEKLYNLVKLSNPLSIDFEYMRTTTIPHMLEALERNYSRKNVSAKLFENGKIFLNAENIEEGELPVERTCLTFGMYGNNYNFYSLKNEIMNILNSLRLSLDIRRSYNIMMHPGISADILCSNDVIASIGKVSPKIIGNYTLPEETFIGVIYLDKVFENLSSELKYKELPKFPAVERDIAFVIDTDILSGDIVKSLINSNELVENVTLFDVYQGSQIESGKKSMAYKIRLRDINKTLDEVSIAKAMDDIFKTLSERFNAVVRK